MAADHIQLILRQLRQQVLRQGQGVHKGGLKLNAVPLAPRPDESNVKLCVVGGQRPSGCKVQEGLDGLRLAGGPHQHLVGDPGELDDVGGQFPLGVYEGLEPLLDLPVVQNHGANLGDDVGLLTQAGGLQVEADDGLVQILVLLPPDGETLVHIVDVVGLGAQKDLALALAGAPSVGKGLGHPVVGDGNGGVPPLDGPLHRILGVGEGIHQGHLGVEVELHPLFRGVVLLHGFFRGLDDQGFQDHVVVKPVEVQPAGDFQVHAHLHPVDDGGPLVPRHELADPDGTGVVSDVKADDPGVALLQLPVLHREHVPLDGDHPHVQLQGVHGLGGLFDLPGAIDPLGGKAPGLLVGGHGGLHGLLPHGFGLAEEFFLLGEVLFRGGRPACRFLRGRGRLRCRGGGGLPSRRHGRLHGGDVGILWGRRGILLSRWRGHGFLHPCRNLGAGGAEGHPPQAVDLGHLPPHLVQQGRGGQVGAEEFHLDGPAMAVHHRPGDQPGLQLGRQGRSGMVFGKHFKERQVSLWHR